LKSLTVYLHRRARPPSHQVPVKYRSVALAERYFAEPGKLQPLSPTLTFQDRLMLVRGDRIIDVLWLGRAHTRGDLVIHLPKEGIVFTGDIVAGPIPLIGSTSFPMDYGPTLEKLLALKASVYVPGHGPVMKDDSYRAFYDRVSSFFEPLY
jgi:glyoxylase-like metal-dependent hydrolase (beta-lactamase superfamily II)